MERSDRRDSAGWRKALSGGTLHITGSKKAERGTSGAFLLSECT
jgi:hypothetical protein